MDLNPYAAVQSLFEIWSITQHLKTSNQWNDNYEKLKRLAVIRIENRRNQQDSSHNVIESATSGKTMITTCSTIG